MACEGADRQADFPCAALHRTHTFRKGLVLTEKANWGMGLGMCVCVILDADTSHPMVD